MEWSNILSDVMYVIYVIYNTDIVKDRETLKPRGFAFVAFATHKQAKLAMYKEELSLTHPE